MMELGSKPYQMSCLLSFRNLCSNSTFKNILVNKSEFQCVSLNKCSSNDIVRNVLNMKIRILHCVYDNDNMHPGHVWNNAVICWSGQSSFDILTQAISNSKLRLVTEDDCFEIA